MKILKNKIKAIIFDMDGTIINTETAWRNATIDFLSQKGHFVSHDDGAFLKSLSGIGLVQAMTAIKKRYEISESVEILVNQKIAIANEHLKQSSEFIEGFIDFHKKLRDSEIPSSIATNSSPENLIGLVEKMNFKDFFGDHIYCIADVNHKPKPDPALFLHAAQKLNVRPEECVVFEDSIYGFEAARAAGMKCIAIKSDNNHDQLHHTHDAIATYHEAEEALKKL